MARATAPTFSDDAPCFRDGLGERRSVTDGSGQVRELLCIRSELTAVPSFEGALRDRLQQLAEFRHPYFAPALAVESVTGPDATLGLLSEQVAGIRLSSLFKQAAARGLNLDINASLCLIRQIVLAIARFHELCGEASHGALGPDRVVLTASGRLMVSDYVFGAALEQLRYSQDRYWRELRVAVPHSVGLPRFDHRTDVTQVGVIALSLILGRTLRDDEYPARVGDVVTTAKAIAPKGGFEPLPPSLRGWLSRALQLDVRQAFGTATEAHEELERVMADFEYPGLPASVETFLIRYQEAEPLVRTVPPDDVIAPEVVPRRTFAPQSDQHAVDQVTIAPPAGSTQVDDALMTDFAPETDLSTTRGRPDPDLQSAYDAMSAVRDLFAIDAPRSRSRWTVPVGLGVAVALGAAAVPMWDRVTSRQTATTGTGTLVISTSPRGATASLDGSPLGVTPLAVTVLAGLHTLEVRGEGEPKTLPVVMTAGARLEQYIELPVAAAANAIEGAPEISGGALSAEEAAPLAADVGPPPTPAVSTPTPAAASPDGWLALRTPIELSIEEGGTVLGTSASGRVSLSSGRHVLTLRNDALAFQTTRTVQVSPDGVTTATIAVPNGLVSVNASPWAEVWLDGARVGETPVGNLSVPIGPHEVLLRHPELGEQHRQIAVSATGVTRLSVDLHQPEGDQANADER